jgi:hypothetical protein
MMNRTVFGCRSNCGAQAWLGQATGAVLPPRSLRTLCKGQILSTDAAVACSTLSKLSPNLARRPPLTHSDPNPKSSRQSKHIGHALPGGFVQSIFSPPPRRPLFKSIPSFSRRVAELKILCIVYQYEIDQWLNWFCAEFWALNRGMGSLRIFAALSSGLHTVTIMPLSLLRGSPLACTDRIRNISLMLFNRSISVSLSSNLSRKSSHSAFDTSLIWSPPKDSGLCRDPSINQNPYRRPERDP